MEFDNDTQKGLGGQLSRAVSNGEFYYSAKYQIVSSAALFGQIRIENE